MDIKFLIESLKNDKFKKTCREISSTTDKSYNKIFFDVIKCHTKYKTTIESAKTFLIDDLGEGLDYSRSARLSKMMFDYCEAHDIQLIVTSNDKFLMNAIDLNHWIILQRYGDEVKTFSRSTYPDMFTKFRKMGLNNFDILSTDFIERFLSQVSK